MMMMKIRQERGCLPKVDGLYKLLLFFLLFTNLHISVQLHHILQT